MLNDERDSRCFPIAIALMKIVGDWQNHVFNSQDKTKTFEAYNLPSQQILQLCLERNIPCGEYGYIQQLVNTAFDQVNSIVTESLNKHVRTVQEKTFGCQLHEMKMQDLHERIGGDKVEV